MNRGTVSTEQAMYFLVISLVSHFGLSMFGLLRLLALFYQNVCLMFVRNNMLLIEYLIFDHERVENIDTGKRCIKMTDLIFYKTYNLEPFYCEYFGDPGVFCFRDNSR